MFIGLMPLLIKKENDFQIDCDDTSSYTDCQLVVARSLCVKWGKFCCRTCRLAGYPNYL